MQPSVTKDVRACVRACVRRSQHFQKTGTDKHMTTVDVVDLLTLIVAVNRSPPVSAPRVAANRRVPR